MNDESTFSKVAKTTLLSIGLSLSVCFLLGTFATVHRTIFHVSLSKERIRVLNDKVQAAGDSNNISNDPFLKRNKENADFFAHLLNNVKAQDEYFKSVDDNKCH